MKPLCRVCADILLDWPLRDWLIEEEEDLSIMSQLRPVGCRYNALLGGKVSKEFLELVQL
jgi:hypothetical protein